jgi:hypothetical protein
MRWISALIAVAAMMFAATTASAAISTTFDPSAAPTGTHVAGKTAPSCSVSGLTVTCVSFELAGVGNTNATANLTANYTGTVDCFNKGQDSGPIESHQTSLTDTATSGQLSPKNGRLVVPRLSASPTQREISGAVFCPNPNWTAVLREGSLTLTDFTYTVSFAGFTGDYLTITGP